MQPTFDGYLYEGADVLNANSRNYVSVTGSFLEIDPLYPLSNPYSYCFGNPVMLRDPTGLNPQWHYIWIDGIGWYAVPGVEIEGTNNPGLHDSPSYGGCGGWPGNSGLGYSIGSNPQGSGGYEGRDWDDIDAVVVFHFSDLKQWFVESSLTTKLIIDMVVATIGLGITSAGSFMASDAYQQIISYEEFIQQKCIIPNAPPGSSPYVPAYPSVLQGLGFWYTYLTVASSLQIAGITTTTTAIGCAAYYYQSTHPEQYQYVGKVGWW